MTTKEKTKLLILRDRITDLCSEAGIKNPSEEGIINVADNDNFFNGVETRNEAIERVKEINTITHVFS